MLKLIYPSKWSNTGKKKVTEKVTELVRKKSQRKKSHNHEINNFMLEMDTILFLLILILLKLFCIGWFYVLIINFQSCLDVANTSQVLKQFSWSLLEAYSSAQYIHIAALGLHPPFLWFHGVPSHHHVPYTRMVPIFRHMFQLFSISRARNDF